jgi:polar amino acid transport system substrate-binding protein
VRTSTWLAIALALGAVPRADARDLPEILRSGRLRVAAVVEEKEPEFLSLRAGGAPGFDREVLEGFAHRHGLVLDLVTVPSWEGLVPALLSGKADLIAGRVTDTPARRRQIDFSNEVFPTRVVVVTRKPRAAVFDARELTAVKVGTIPGTSMAEALTLLGVPAVKVAPLTAGALSEALRDGRVDAAVWSVEGAILARRKDADLELGAFLGPPQSLAYGTGKGQGGLLAALNDHIRLVKETGTWNRLVVKYFGAAAPDILGRARRAD